MAHSIRKDAREFILVYSILVVIYHEEMRRDGKK